MAAFTSEEQICNMANGLLGMKASINNISTPTSDKEIIYALWFPICRQYMLKKLMPNFALARQVLSPITVPSQYTNEYGYAYPLPAGCLKLLGLGPADTMDTKPTIEANMILTNVWYDNAPTARFIADITDVSQFSPDFIFSLASLLSKCVALATTQDPGKLQAASQSLLESLMDSTAQNAQENKPVRVSRSRFREARRTNHVPETEKR